MIPIPWPPTTGNHTTKFGRGGFYTVQSVKDYRIHIAWIIKAAGLDKKLSGPLEIHWTGCPPDNRAVDADNIMKVVHDALTRAGLWKDDSNKIIKKTTFVWGDPVPDGLLELTVKDYQPEDL